MADERPGAIRQERGALGSPPQMQSGVSGLEWLPIVTGRAASLAALLDRLDTTQWLDAASLAERQLAQLAPLAHFAARHSSHFRARLERAKLTPDALAAPGGLAKLAILTRRELQTAGDAFYCTENPTDHLPMSQTRTSGSTGEPVVTRRTEVTALFWQALTMRDHLWHGRDFSAPMAAIRANIPARAQLADWGNPAKLLYRTGPSLGLPNKMDVRQLAEALAAFQPGSLLVNPGTLAALTDHCRNAGLRLPALRHLRTFGETLAPRAREEVTAFWNAPVEDAYSSEEFGYIALQCPLGGLYHTMAESVLVEVLDDSGEPCREGQIGRIVITDLHNFATPLIRYEIGDLAEVGGVCPCGRGLAPTFKHIVGRVRNLVLMPDGTRHWPHVGFKRFRDAAPINQYQFIQTGREQIEVRLVAERPVTAAEEEALRAIMVAALGHPFELQFTYWQGRLPLGAGGKFEEFICRLDASAA